MSILRVACYERVSTTEQAMKGFSIPAQIDKLTEYCNDHGMKIVGHYTDEGKSGTLPPLKRPALQRLLEDVQAGKIDMILFTKLDRWFRSVKEYFKVQSVLDKHNVAWKAIHEDYDTTTANGRMAITIFIAIAQNERDKTSERIKAIYAHKRKNKDASFFGGPHNVFGYLMEKDADGITRLVKNPAEKEMCEEFWKLLIEHDNVLMITRHMFNVYGVKKTTAAWRHIATRSIYCGMYEGIDDYCEAYVSKENWEIVQTRFDAKKQDAKPNRIYLFSGMMRCPMCGVMLTATYSNNTYKGVKHPYSVYRCPNKVTFCNYKRTLSEATLEKMLCERLPEMIEKEIAAMELEILSRKEKPKSNPAALRERMRTLNASYMAGNKTDDEYVQESIEIKHLIEQAEQESPLLERNLSPLKEMLNSELWTTYSTLGLEEKRIFWRNTLKEIKIDDNKIYDVVLNY